MPIKFTAGDFIRKPRQQNIQFGATDFGVQVQPSPRPGGAIRSTAKTPLPLKLLLGLGRLSGAGALTEPVLTTREPLGSLAAGIGQISGAGTLGKAVSVPSKGSLLSVPERVKFSFADRPSRIQFLQEKFPGSRITQDAKGVFQVDGKPIEPRGFQAGDLPGDVADVLSEIVRLGFQIPGAIGGGFLGIPGGPAGIGVGTVAGGGIGRATGQSAVNLIGSFFGLRKGDLKEVAKDIAREGVVGVGGEIAGGAIRGVSSASVTFLKSLFNKFQRKALRPMIQNLFNFTGRIEKSSTQRLQEKGADKILTRENMSESSVLNIAEKIQSGLKRERGRLGKLVGTAREKLRGNKNAIIDIANPRRKFESELARADIIGRTGRAKPSLLIGEEANELVDIQTSLNRIITRRGVRAKKVSPSVALKLIDDLERKVSFGKRGVLKISSNDERIIKILIADLKKEVGKFSKDFRIANAAFEKLATPQEVLQGELNLKRAESFLKRVLRDKSPEFSRQQLVEINKLLPAKDKFLDQLKDVIAARDFASTAFQGIRSGIIGGGLFGIGVPPQLGLPIGIAVSTPRAVGGLLKGQQAAGRAIQAGLRTGVSATQAAASPVISALLSRRSRGLNLGR